MQSSLKQYVNKMLVFLWVFIVVLGYLIYRPYYLKSIFDSPALLGIVSVVGIGGLFGCLIHKLKWKLTAPLAYLLLLLMMCTIYIGTWESYSIDVSDQGSLLAIGGFLLSNVTLHAKALLIYLVCYVLGEKVNKQIQLSGIARIFMSTVIGIMLLTLVLFLLGSVNLLEWYIILLLVLGIIGWGWRELFDLLKKATTYDFRGGNVEKKVTALVIYILGFLAFYCIGAHKLFPIGNDSILIYQNISNLLQQNAGLVEERTAYNWSLFTSIGAILFNSISVSIFLSHSALLLMFMGIISIAKRYMGVVHVFLLISVLISLPGIAFLGFIDAKVDLGYTSVVIAIVLYLIEQTKSNPNLRTDYWKPFVMIGLLLGFAMGIKYLAIIAIASVFAVLLYSLANWRILVSVILLMLGVLFLFNVHRIGYVDVTPKERLLLIATSVILGGVLGLWELRKIARPKLLIAFKKIIVISFAALISFSPWMIKNTIDAKTLSVKTLLFGQDNSRNMKYDMADLDSLGLEISIPNEIKDRFLKYIKTDDRSELRKSDVEFFKEWNRMDRGDKREAKSALKQEVSEGKKVEVGRYGGYEKGIVKYLSLPYDLTMGINVIRNRVGDYGYLLFLMLPLLLFTSKQSQGSRFLLGSIFALVLIFSTTAAMEHFGIEDPSKYLEVIVPSQYQVIDLWTTVSEGYISVQTTLSEWFKPLYNLLSVIPSWIGILLTLAILLLIVNPLRSFWSVMPKGLRVVSVFGFVYSFYWLTVACAIPYYGLPAIIMISILVFSWLGNLQTYVSDEAKRILQIPIYTATVVALMIAPFVLFTNFSNLWTRNNQAFEKSFLQFQRSFESEKEIYSSLFPSLNDIKAILNQNNDHKIYRVGTLMNYHIADNHVRVFDDTQLGYFNKAQSILVNNKDFIDLLKSCDFKYILFDLNIANLDVTKEKTLLKRVNEFVSVLANNNYLDVVYTDRLVESIDPETNRKVVKNGLSGKVVQEGTLAIFSIK